MEDFFKLNVVTPIGVIFKDTVTHVQAPGSTGYFGIKPNHLPLITTLKTGKIIAESTKGRLTQFATTGGYVEMNQNVMTILLETAEKSTDIDVQRAENARDRALERLQDKKPDLDVKRAQAALSRATNRLKIASKF